jgi:hypothetical protein
VKLAAAAALIFFCNALDMSPAVIPPATRGVRSTGWIDFDFQDGRRIFIPARINGHKTMVLLANGVPVPSIDKGFAASIGLDPRATPPTQPSGGDTTYSVGDLEIQVGDITLPPTTATVADLASYGKHIGHAVPVLLGDGAFSQWVIDIDFAHHRIAFRDPAATLKPAGAVELPITRAHDEHLVPFSIEGVTGQFELGLGNSAETLVYQSYYEPHKLLAGRRTSERLGGGINGFVPETVATLHRVEFAGVQAADMPAAFIPAAVTGPLPDVIAGDLGLPMLARFRLIIDYAHDRLYAVPYADAAHAPFAKNRLGLAVNLEDAGFAVRFVAPNSPAQAAGFKVGDAIEQIDGKSPPAWTTPALTHLAYGARGTTVTFTMRGGGVRRVTLADYF